MLNSSFSRRFSPTSSLLSPTSSLIASRFLSSKPSKHVNPRFVTFPIIVIFDMDKMSSAEYLFNIEKIRSSYPVLSVNNFFTRVCEVDAEIADKYFIIRHKMDGRPDVDVLFSRFTTAMTAVLVKESVLFVDKDCPDIGSITDILRTNMGVKKIQIHGFRIDGGCVYYSKELLVAAVRHMSDGFNDETKLDYYEQNLGRLHGMGGLGAVFPDWEKFCAPFFMSTAEVETPNLITAKIGTPNVNLSEIGTPDGRMLASVKEWKGLSRFILMAGREPHVVNGVDVSITNISTFVSIVNTRVVSPNLVPPLQKISYWANKNKSKRKETRGYSTLAARVLRKL